MMKLNGIAEGANCVDFGEFLQFSLMKLGLLDDGMVQRVKNQFSIMDSDGISIYLYVHIYICILTSLDLYCYIYM